MGGTSRNEANLKCALSPCSFLICFLRLQRPNDMLKRAEESDVPPRLRMQDTEWKEAWLGAERVEALEATTEALEAPDAWHPAAAAAWDSIDLDDPAGASSPTAM